MLTKFRPGRREMTIEPGHPPNIFFFPNSPLNKFKFLCNNNTASLLIHFLQTINVFLLSVATPGFYKKNIFNF